MEPGEECLSPVSPNRHDIVDEGGVGNADAGTVNTEEQLEE